MYTRVTYIDLEKKLQNDVLYKSNSQRLTKGIPVQRKISKEDYFNPKINKEGNLVSVIERDFVEKEYELNYSKYLRNTEYDEKIGKSINGYGSIQRDGVENERIGPLKLAKKAFSNLISKINEKEIIRKTDDRLEIDMLFKESTNKKMEEDTYPNTEPNKIGRDTYYNYYSSDKAVQTDNTCVSYPKRKFPENIPLTINYNSIKNIQNNMLLDKKLVLIQSYWRGHIVRYNSMKKYHQIRAFVIIMQKFIDLIKARFMKKFKNYGKKLIIHEILNNNFPQESFLTNNFSLFRDKYDDKDDRDLVSILEDKKVQKVIYIREFSGLQVSSNGNFNVIDKKKKIVFDKSFSEFTIPSIKKKEEIKYSNKKDNIHKKPKDVQSGKNYIGGRTINNEKNSEIIDQPIPQPQYALLHINNSINFEITKDHYYNNLIVTNSDLCIISDIINNTLAQINDSNKDPNINNDEQDINVINNPSKKKIIKTIKVIKKTKKNVDNITDLTDTKGISNICNTFTPNIFPNNILFIDSNQFDLLNLKKKIFENRHLLIDNNSLYIDNHKSNELLYRLISNETFEINRIKCQDKLFLESDTQTFDILNSKKSFDIDALDINSQVFDIMNGCNLFDYSKLTSKDSNMDLFNFRNRVYNIDDLKLYGYKFDIINANPKVFKDNTLVVNNIYYDIPNHKNKMFYELKQDEFNFDIKNMKDKSFESNILTSANIEIEIFSIRRNLFNADNLKIDNEHLSIHTDKKKIFDSQCLDLVNEYLTIPNDKKKLFDSTSLCLEYETMNILNQKKKIFENNILVLVNDTLDIINLNKKIFESNILKLDNDSMNILSNRKKIFENELLYLDYESININRSKNKTFDLEMLSLENEYLDIINNRIKVFDNKDLILDNETINILHKKKKFFDAIFCQNKVTIDIFADKKKIFDSGILSFNNETMDILNDTKKIFNSNLLSFDNEIINIISEKKKIFDSNILSYNNETMDIINDKKKIFDSTTLSYDNESINIINDKLKIFDSTILSYDYEFMDIINDRKKIFDSTTLSYDNESMDILTENKKIFDSKILNLDNESINILNEKFKIFDSRKLFFENETMTILNEGKRKFNHDNLYLETDRINILNEKNKTFENGLLNLQTENINIINERKKIFDYSSLDVINSKLDICSMYQKFDSKNYDICCTNFQLINIKEIINDIEKISFNILKDKTKAFDNLHLGIYNYHLSYFNDSKKGNLSKFNCDNPMDLNLQSSENIDIYNRDCNESIHDIINNKQDINNILYISYDYFELLSKNELHTESTNTKKKTVKIVKQIVKKKPKEEIIDSISTVINTDYFEILSYPKLGNLEIYGYDMELLSNIKSEIESDKYIDNDKKKKTKIVKQLIKKKHKDDVIKKDNTSNYEIESNDILITSSNKILRGFENNEISSNTINLFIDKDESNKIETNKVSSITKLNYEIIQEIDFNIVYFKLINGNEKNVKNSVKLGNDNLIQNKNPEKKYEVFNKSKTEFTNSPFKNRIQYFIDESIEEENEEEDIEEEEEIEILDKVIRIKIKSLSIQNQNRFNEIFNNYDIIMKNILLRRYLKKWKPLKIPSFLSTFKTNRSLLNRSQSFRINLDDSFKLNKSYSLSIKKEVNLTRIFELYKNKNHGIMRKYFIKMKINSKLNINEKIELEPKTIIKKIQFVKYNGELSEYVSVKKNINIFMKYLKPRLYYFYKWKGLKDIESEKILLDTVKNYELTYEEEI